MGLFGGYFQVSLLITIMQAQVKREFPTAHLGQLDPLVNAKIINALSGLWWSTASLLNFQSEIGGKTKRKRSYKQRASQAAFSGFVLLASAWVFCLPGNYENISQGTTKESPDGKSATCTQFPVQRVKARCIFIHTFGIQKLRVLKNLSYFHMFLTN